MQPGVPRGTLSGRVAEVEKDTPIAGARIFVRGMEVVGRTNSEGAFSIDLPAGTFSLSVIHTEYATQTMDSVQVFPNETMTLAVELTPSAVELEQYSVVAVRIEGGLASLIEERRVSSDVIEVIGAEQISKAGDSDAADALKRVTGLAVVDGMKVFVRGRGVGYSSSLV